MGRPAGLRLRDRVGLLDVGSEGEVGGCAHGDIVGRGADHASPGREWEGDLMNAVVLIFLILALLGIVVAGVFVVVAALNTRSRD